MTIPTNEWTPGGDNGFGQIEPHVGGTPIDAMDMWDDLLTDISAFMPATAGFDSVTMYSKPTQDDPSVPVAIIPFTIVGANASTEQARASMQTWSFRTTLFGRFKLVLLDCPVAAGWDNVLAVDWGAEDLAILGALSDLNKGWCGRDGAAIQSGINKSFKLSDVLRRKYEMD